MKPDDRDELIVKFPFPSSDIVILDPGIKLPDKNPPKPSDICIDPYGPG